MSDDESAVTASCGNVFADSKLPDPETTLLTALAVRKVHQLTAARSLTGARAAELLGLTTSEYADIVRHTSDLPLERLLRCMRLLGYHFDFAVYPLHKTAAPVDPATGHPA